MVFDELICRKKLNISFIQFIHLRLLAKKNSYRCFLLILCIISSIFFFNTVYAAMYGYATNATGIYRIDTATGNATLVYSGAPFNATTAVAAVAMRPSDGMLFFAFNSTTNQPIYSWDPANPSTPPVLLGTTGTGVPYIHRLTAHPVTGTIYGIDPNPATTLWIIDQTTGAASAAATISGLPVNTSGDIAFDPTTGNLYAPIQPGGSPTATIYLIPLTGGAVVNVGTVTGLPTAGVLNSAMFDSLGTLYIGGGSTSLWTVPITGGPVNVVGDMGFLPQDFASIPVPDLEPSVTKSFSPDTISVGGTSVLTITLTNNYGFALRGASLTDTYPAGLVNATPPNASTTCGGTLTATAGGNSISLTGGTIPANGSCSITVTVTSSTAGIYNNSIPIRGLTTALAYNKNSASATLTVGNTGLYIKGRVFEDVNYGGGAGRSFSASSGVPVSNVRVELYNSSGNFVTFTTTNGSGEYIFSGLTAGNYTVRVVNGSVASTRAGACPAGTCIPVQTYRTDVSSGIVTDVTDRVGGEAPHLVDAGNGSTTLADLTTATTTAQSITSVSLSSNVSGVDFGYNFSTIVSTRDSGQGSLRQFITNANALAGDTFLSQAGYRVDSITGATVPLPAGFEHSIFMIPDGQAHPGLRSGLVNQLTGGVAVIPITSSLPQITATVRIEGGTQTYNVGNTNNVVLGTGGTVGVSNNPLPQLNAPEVELRDGPTGAGGSQTGLNIQAPNVYIRSMAVVGFGGTGDSDNDGNIVVGNYIGTYINQCVLGTTATSFTDPGGTLRGTGDNIRITAGAGSGTVSQNLIGYSAGNGIGTAATSSTGWVIEFNEIRGNGVGNNNRDGIEWNFSNAQNIIRYNLIAGNRGNGIHIESNNADQLLITENTISGNGFGASVGGISSTSGDNNTISLNIIDGNTGPGIEFQNGATGNTVTQNRIRNNTYSGVEVDNGATTNLISQNSIYGNGRIGIDLLTSAQGGTPVAPYYTHNDNGDGDTGGNNVLNFPQITSATINGSNITITGIAPAGAIIEFFIADNDASGFGEGQTYLITKTEGSADDTALGTGTNAVSCGGGGPSVTMNNFSFTFTKPSGVFSGTKITTTATFGNNTSEFSCNATVTNLTPPSLTVVKSVITYSDPVNGTTNPKIIPGSEMIYTIVVTNSGGGAVDSNSIVLTDPIPANMVLCVSNTCSNPPVTFSCSSTPPCGLTFNYASDVTYYDASNNPYTPVPDSAGYDANARKFSVNPKGVLNGSTGPPHPNFTITFKGKVQ